MSTPLVEIISISKSKISNKDGMNQSVIKVRFDQDVAQYIAMLRGVSHITGKNIHYGGSVIAGSTADIIIDWNELDVEGENKINIYGQAIDGSWTGEVIFIPSGYGRAKYGQLIYGKKG